MEALILYFVLFFPGIYGSPFPGGPAQTELIPFSILRELGRTLSYTLPSLALLWYIIPEKKGFSLLLEEKPHERDIRPLIIGIPGLIIIGLFISVLVSLFSKTLGLPLSPKVEAPVNFWGWIVMIFSCLGTGYLEESYFRYYLLTKLENPIPHPAWRIAFSTVLFALCHIYEGPWGIINALLAGVLLSMLFIRYRSLHGIALAHAVYNMFVYFMGIFS